MQTHPQIEEVRELLQPLRKLMGNHRETGMEIHPVAVRSIHDIFVAIDGHLAQLGHDLATHEQARKQLEEIARDLELIGRARPYGASPPPAATAVRCGEPPHEGTGGQKATVLPFRLPPRAMFRPVEPAGPGGAA